MKQNYAVQINGTVKRFNNKYEWLENHNRETKFVVLLRSRRRKKILSVKLLYSANRNPNNS